MSRMRRAAISVFVLGLGAGCTAAEPKPDPVITRHFHGSFRTDAPPTDKIFDEAMEAHGISCPMFDGSTWSESTSWRTSCSGTQRQWADAEATLARLIEEGVAKESVPRSDHSHAHR